MAIGPDDEIDHEQARVIAEFLAALDARPDIPYSFHADPENVRSRNRSGGSRASRPRRIDRGSSHALFKRKCDRCGHTYGIWPGIGSPYCLSCRIALGE